MFGCLVIWIYILAPPLEWCVRGPNIKWFNPTEKLCAWDGPNDCTQQDGMTEPIETIYVNNLNDKVPLSKLKAELQVVFQKYGTIVQLTAHRNLKMKGQAFITYENKESSRAAMEKLQDHELFGKKVRVSYAKANSDNYHRDILKDDEAIEARKQLKAKAQTDTAARGVKKPGTKKVESWKSIPPNKILLIQNLGPQVANSELLDFFEGFGGFINSRLVKARSLSFIEFENEVSATGCLEAMTPDRLKNFGDEAILTYAKK